MKSLNFAPVRETQQHEEDLSRMSDEGCPNDPVLSLPNETESTVRVTPWNKYPIVQSLWAWALAFHSPCWIS